MEDHTKYDNESYTQDHVGTGAEISTENDVPANLNDGPASANLHDDGAPSSAPVVALESPYAAHERRSSTISPRKEDSSLNAATAAASTVAGAEAGALLEREIFQHELAQSVADNAQLHIPPRSPRRRALMRSRQLLHCAANSRPLAWSSKTCAGHVRTSQRASPSGPTPRTRPRPRRPTKLSFYAFGRSSWKTTSTLAA